LFPFLPKVNFLIVTSPIRVGLRICWSQFNGSQFVAAVAVLIHMR
jgi:hypothetical protein